MSDRKPVISTKRRDMSPLGVAPRKRFDESLNLLRALGLSPVAIEHYRQRGRKTHRLPHEFVCAMAEGAARFALTTMLVMHGRPSRVGLGASPRRKAVPHPFGF